MCTLKAMYCIATSAWTLSTPWQDAKSITQASLLCPGLQMPQLLTSAEVRHHWLHGYAAAWLGLEAAEEASGTAKKRSSRGSRAFQQPARVCIRPEGRPFQKVPTDGKVTGLIHNCSGQEISTGCNINLAYMLSPSMLIGLSNCVVAAAI